MRRRDDRSYDRGYDRDRDRDGGYRREYREPERDRDRDRDRWREREREPRRATPPLEVAPARGPAAALGFTNAFMFSCSTSTEHECRERSLFCGKVALQSQVITARTAVLLLNVPKRLVIGLFRPAGPPGVDLEPHAFGRQFPHQLRVVPLAPLRCVHLDTLADQHCSVMEGTKIRTGALSLHCVEQVLDVMLRKGEPYPSWPIPR
jgi:hypothetical protein